MPLAQPLVKPAVFEAGLSRLSKSRIRKLSPVVSICTACTWQAHCFQSGEPPTDPKYIFAHAMLCTQHFIGSFDGDRFDTITAIAKENGYDASIQYVLDTPMLLHVMLLARTANIWQAIHWTLASKALSPEADAAAAHALAVSLESSAFWACGGTLEERVQAILAVLNKICGASA